MGEIYLRLMALNYGLQHNVGVKGDLTNYSDYTAGCIETQGWNSE